MNIIKADLEIFEIFNAFPFLKNKLEKENFDLSDIKEGISLYDYFKNKSYSIDEINILIKKLNFDVKYYLKNKKLPEKKGIKILKS